MIGDPLYDSIARRREARRPKATPAPPRPEGVAKYQCLQTVEVDAYGEKVGWALCARTAEAKPYAAKPVCHGQPMAITGYDWERDVEA